MTHSGDHDRDAPRDAAVDAAKRIGRRILVVDDNEDQAHSLGMLLTVLGHETRMAFDGLTAVEAAIEFRPEFALIDIGIPGIDGLEVARRIRSMPHLQKTVLVAQTGWGLDDDRARSRTAGFDHHLIKPLDLPELQRILSTRDLDDTPLVPKPDGSA